MPSLFINTQLKAPKEKEKRRQPKKHWSDTL